MRKRILEKCGLMSVWVVISFILLIAYYTDTFTRIKRTEVYSGDVVVLGHFTEAQTKENYKCAGITLKTLDKETNIWQQVNKNSTTYVFSAYFILEYKKIVVIAIKKQIKIKLFFCQFWHKGDVGKYNMLYQIHATILKLPEDHGHE